MRKRFSSMIMVLMVCLSILPVQVLANEASQTTKAPATDSENADESSLTGRTIEAVPTDYLISLDEEPDAKTSSGNREEEMLAPKTYGEQKASINSKDSNGSSNALLQNSDDHYIRNTFIEAHIGDNGQFTMGTVEGNPNSNTDNYKRLLYGHPETKTSQTLIQIDGGDYWFYDYVNSVIFSDNHESTATATIGDTGVTVRQILTLEQNPVTGRDDIISIRYTYTNTSQLTKRVGIRIMLDTELGENDGAPFRVNDREVTTETEYEGNKIPQYWQCFDNLTNPNVVATGTFYYSLEDIRPDKVQFAYWGDIHDSSWDYLISEERTLTGDSAVAVYFNPRNLPASGSSTVVTYYGISEFADENTDLEPPLATRISAPKNLYGSDLIAGYLNNPFDIRAYMANYDNSTLSDVWAVLSIENGSQLVLNSSQNSTIHVGVLAAGESRTIQWNIRAIPQGTSTEAKYSIRFYDGTSLLKTVRLSTTLNFLNTDSMYRTVTFDLNGGSGTVPPTQKVLVGTLAKKPEEPTREGYQFDGWYANKDCSGTAWFNVLNLYQGELVRGNITLYAKWIERITIQLEDLYSFSNFYDDFNSTYQMSDEYFEILTKDLWLHEKLKMQLKRDETWSGSCLGLVVTEALFKTGTMDLNFFAPRSKSVRNIEATHGKPVNNSRVESYINYYQLLQHRKEYQDRVTKLYSVLNENVCNTLLDMTRAAYKTNSFIAIRVTRLDPVSHKPAGVHVLMGYQVTSDGNNQYRIHVIDSNENTDIDGTYLTVDQNAHNITLHSNDPRYNNISLINGRLKIVDVASSNAYNCIDLQSELINRGNETVAPMSVSDACLMDTESKMTLVTNYPAFHIKSSRDSATVNVDIVDGSIAISLSAIYGEDNSAQYVYEIDDCDSFEITPVEDDSLITYDTVFEGKFLAYAFADMPSTVSVNNTDISFTCNSEEKQHLRAGIVADQTLLPIESVEIDGELPDISLSYQNNRFAVSSTIPLYGSVLTMENEKNAVQTNIEDNIQAIQITAGNNAEQIRILDEESHTIDTISMKYTVSFYTHGGSTVPSQSGIASGGKVTKPEDPEFPGYVFAGWYLDPECTDGNEFNFNNHQITGDTVLHAKWLVDESYSHTVTFKANGYDDIILIIQDGDSLNSEQVPIVPEYNGRSGLWDVSDFSNIHSDIIVLSVKLKQGMMSKLKEIEKAGDSRAVK